LNERLPEDLETWIERSIRRFPKKGDMKERKEGTKRKGEKMDGRDEYAGSSFD